VIVIEDKSPKSRDDIPYKAFMYLNPNATNGAISASSMRDTFYESNRVSPDVIEDYVNDNY
jgi:hypothetical protein